MIDKKEIRLKNAHTSRKALQRQSTDAALFGVFFFLYF